MSRSCLLWFGNSTAADQRRASARRGSCSVSTEKRRRAAAALVRRGVAVIPVPAGEKNPGRPGWEALRITEEEIPNYWTNGQNVGLLCGAPSGHRVDVDLDPDEAVRIAGRFLPPTLTSGRESRPHSHWWYVSPGVASC